ncbi:restriction endonuclease subunit S [Listeria booriae]|uniref:restriction endonuclease subunit S n=1 Tax=Listeria booriae TaxID=1552123 RepID=UPI001C8BC43E|nr:restriction endonuclease subunit S [Listeria booriae]
MAFIANVGVAPKGDRYNRSSLVSDIENKLYKKTKLGDFIYSSNNLESNSIGLNKYGKASISPVYSIFQPTEITDSDFLGRRLVRKDFINSMVKWRQGVIYGQWRIHESDFIKIEVLVPLLEEQKKIGSFLDDLDRFIALHQRKLDALKQMKKGFLQQLFPESGEKLPRVRFTGFEGEWEQRRLGDYAEILTGGTPKTSISEYWEPKKIPWISSGEVNKRRLDGTDNMISEEGLNNSSARWVKAHSVLIALAGQGKTRGTVAVNNIRLTTNQSIAAIVLKDNLHYEFVYQNLFKRYDELRMFSSGDGTRGGLNKQIVSDVVIPSPNKEEQFKIGAFFKHLDNTITLYQYKLDQLNILKKSCLQNMFI